MLARGDAAVAQTSSGGIASVAIPGAGEAVELIALRDGYLPQPFRVGGSEPTDVVMERGHRVVISCVDAAGMPVADCRVIVGTRGTIPALYPADGDGAPDCERPIWARTTDSAGEAHFDALPAGAYSIGTAHAARYAVRSDPNRLHVPGPPCVVTMEALWGVVLVAPGHGKIVAQRIRVKGCSQTPAHFAVVHARQRLAAEHPDALVRVGVASGPSPPFVEAIAALADGTLLVGAAPMRPLTEPVAPVRLDPAVPARPAGTVTVRLRCDGRVVDGVPLDLGLEEYKLGWWAARTGETWTVPAGDYGVGLGLPADALRAWVEDARFSVAGGQHVAIELSASVDARWVSVRPRTPQGIIDTPMAFTVVPNAPRSFTIANWYTGCDRDPLRLLLPAGPTTFRAGGAGYGRLERTILVEGDDTAVDLVLEERR